MCLISGRWVCAEMTNKRKIPYTGCETLTVGTFMITGDYSFSMPLLTTVIGSISFQDYVSLSIPLRSTPRGSIYIYLYSSPHFRLGPYFRY
jgi:hypothetical protein